MYFIYLLITAIAAATIAVCIVMAIMTLWEKGGDDNDRL